MAAHDYLAQVRVYPSRSEQHDGFQGAVATESKHAVVHFHLKTGKVIEVTHTGEGVEVRCLQGRLVVRPRSGNVVTVEQEDT